MKTKIQIVFFAIAIAMVSGQCFGQSIVEGIQKKAAFDFPSDYTMQEFVIKEEVKAYNDLGNLAKSYKGNQLAEAIIAKAGRDFRQDYTMQLFAIREEVSAGGRLASQRVKVVENNLSSDDRKFLSKWREAKNP